VAEKPSAFKPVTVTVKPSLVEVSNKQEYTSLGSSELSVALNEVCDAWCCCCLFILFIYFLSYLWTRFLIVQSFT
jgi:hypothetical protein